MAQHIAVVGAGIIGASIAYRLAQAGARVSVIDAGMPATAASGRSFGWINASFFADAAHFRLRAEGISAYRRLHEELDDLPVTWPGCLWWEETGTAFDAMAAKLTALEYPVQEIDRTAFVQMEPAIAAPPERALLFPSDGAADAGALTHAMLRAATALGAQVISGCRVTGLQVDRGRIAGVQTGLGVIQVDQVIIAAGTGVPELLSPVDVTVPMLQRPGVLMHTQPVPTTLNHILVAPGQEVRQLADGRVLAPTAASHQSDSSDTVTSSPQALAEIALQRLRRMMPEVDFALDQVTVAMRPVPQDGLPVIGRCGPHGLYVAVMHSGVTLGPLVGELVAGEVLNGPDQALLAPYRPGRFS
jgi:glycine/D-amino acid oxidase-like deaminating enzyme